MNSIRGKILFLILISIVSISIIIGLLLMSQTKSAYDKDTFETYNQETAKYTALFNHELMDVEKTGYAIKVMVESLFDTSAYLSDSNYLDEFETIISPSIERFAKETSKSHSAYMFFAPELDDVEHDVWFSDLNGNGDVVRQPEVTLSFYDNQTATKDWYFVPKATGKSFWSLPFSGVTDFNHEVLYVSRTYPVIIDNLFVGIAGSDYYFDKMAEDIHNIEVLKTGYAVLVDPQGEFIVKPDSNDSILYEKVKEWTNDMSFDTDRGIIEFFSDDEKNYFIYSKLENNWILSIVLKDEEVFKWYYDLRFMLFGITVISIFLIGLVALEIGRFVTKPIIDLSMQVSKIGSGNYKHMITTDDYSNAQETLFLAESIENMRILQNYSFDKINNQNKNLEIEVKERTDSLKKNNDRLESSLVANEKKNQTLRALNKELEDAISNMRVTQKQLLETEKMASLSFIVTRMAHEFNTPIGSFLTLLTFLETQKKLVENNLENDMLRSEELILFLRRFDDSYDLIIKNLGQITNLVDRFKALDSYNQISIHAQIKLKEFLEVILKSIEYDEDKVKIDINCNDKIELMVDAGKLSQIFIHLIENAIIHGFDNLNAGHVQIDINKNDRNLFVRIRDDGRGMSEERVRQIFVPFYSGELSSKSSGLGLNVVYNLVTKVFDGQIICKSKVNEGTSFEMILTI